MMLDDWMWGMGRPHLIGALPTDRHDDSAGSQRQHKGASPIHDQPGEKGRSLLNVQQKFRIVRQLALKLHRLEVRVELQDLVLAAASDI